MSKPPSLLKPFFSDAGGSILYKAYPPQRGDDVAALLKLATSLPDTVRFVPVPPERNLLQDLRYLLPQLLLDEDVLPHGALGLTPEQWTQLGEGDTEELGEPWSPELQQKIKELFEPLLEQALARIYTRAQTPSPVSKSKAALERVLRQLESRRPMLRVFYRAIAAHPMNLASRKDPPEGDQNAEEYLRGVYHVPRNAPVLLVGRPELFLGYSWTRGGRFGDLRQLMDECGFPNRYHYLGDPEIRPEVPPSIRDRKTFQIFRNVAGEGSEDSGFIFAGRTAEGQVAMVATGGTSLGTYAAIQLLLEDRPCFRKAMERFLETDCRERLDIAFICRYEHLEKDYRRPQRARPDSLAVELINPGDLLGYSWSRSSHRAVGDALASSREESAAAPSSDEVEPRPMVWSAKPARDVGPLELVDVTISARAYRVMRDRYIYPDAALGRLLDTIHEHLEYDSDEWRRQLGKQGCKEMAADPTYATFRPILLYGPTGVGKDWIARFISRGWEGRDIVPFVQAGKATPKQVLDQMRKHIYSSLEVRREEWRPLWERAVDSEEGYRHLVCLAGMPHDLFTAELFGIAPGVATDVNARLGAFHLSGSGVLYLDELFELGLELQAWLLVVLQSGKVTPVGLGEQFPYLCRVVAATNVADTEEGLSELTVAQGDKFQRIRSDLLARLRRRYRVPPLVERPLEVVPILMQSIMSERLLGRPGAPEKLEDFRLRISEPALDALMMFSFPENVRDAEKLAVHLSDKLIDNMLTSADDTEDGVRCSSIRLRDLGILGVSPGDGQGPSGRFVQSVPTTEDKFYEFRLEPGRVVDPREPPADDLLKNTCRRLLSEKGHLEALRQAASVGVERARVAGEVGDGTFRELVELEQTSIGTVGNILLDAHQKLRAEQRDQEGRVHGLSEGKLTELLKLPFFKVHGQLVEEVKVLGEGDSDLHDRVLNSLNAHLGTLSPTRRSYLRTGVFLSVLLGKNVERRFQADE